jgi:hypothetical protein
MAPEFERPRSNLKVLWIILGIVGGLFLLCGLSCAGLVYWGFGMFKQFPAMTASADAFINDLSSGQVDAAYNRTSSAFKSRMNAQQFQAFIDRFPALRKQTSRSTQGFNINQTPQGLQGVIKTTVLGPNDSLSFTLVLVEENGAWKINDMTVP